MGHNNNLFQNGTEQEDCRLVFRCAVWMSSGWQHSHINDLMISLSFSRQMMGSTTFKIGRDSFQIIV